MTSQLINCRIRLFDPGSSEEVPISLYFLTFPPPPPSGTVLEEVKDVKYLGVTVSDDLEWTKHINAITTKANSKFSFLRASAT